MQKTLMLAAILLLLIPVVIAAAFFFSTKPTGNKATFEDTALTPRILPLESALTL